jgi:hypothetical protein
MLRNLCFIYHTRAVYTYSLKLTLHPHMWFKLTKYPNHWRQRELDLNNPKLYPRQRQKIFKYNKLYPRQTKFTQLSDRSTLSENYKLEIKWLSKAYVQV